MVILILLLLRDVLIGIELPLLEWIGYASSKSIDHFDELFSKSNTKD
jgi:hypothetical protein